MYKKILVVVDDRVVTQSAIRQAIEMAQGFRADVHFFYVLPSLEGIGFDIPVATNIPNVDTQKTLVAHAQGMLAAACELAEQAGIHCLSAVGFSADAAQCVADAARRKHCNLIVVGTEEKNAVLRILTGSIVPRLISVASVPVLVCREAGSASGHGRRTAVSIRAKQKRIELLERRRREQND